MQDREPECKILHSSSRSCIQDVLFSACLEVDVGEKQLLVAAVDDGGVVGAGKHVRHPSRFERLQDQRFGTEEHSLPRTEVAWGVCECVYMRERERERERVCECV